MVSIYITEYCSSEGDQRIMKKHEINDYTSVVVTGNTFITIKKFFFSKLIQYIDIIH